LRRTGKGSERTRHRRRERIVQPHVDSRSLLGCCVATMRFGRPGGKPLPGGSRRSPDRGRGVVAAS
jgi:hypothetical protein